MHTLIKLLKIIHIVIYSNIYIYIYMYDKYYKESIINEKNINNFKKGHSLLLGYAFNDKIKFDYELIKCSH